MYPWKACKSIYGQEIESVFRTHGSTVKKNMVAVLRLKGKILTRKSSLTSS